MFGSYELWSLFLYLEIFVPFVGACGPGVMYSSRSILCTAYAMFVASPSFPASCTVQQRAAIPALDSSLEFSRLHRSVSTVEPSSNSFSLVVPCLLGFDFGTLCAVSPARFGASPFLFVFCLCLACTANWKPFVLFFSEIHFREIYPSTCRATLNASWSPSMLPT